MIKIDLLISSSQQNPGKIYDTQNRDPAAWALDGSVALVARTALGPVIIGGSFGNNQHRKWWFGVGRIF